jgi:hypothetical protein
MSAAFGARTLMYICLPAFRFASPLNRKPMQRSGLTAGLPHGQPLGAVQPHPLLHRSQDAQRVSVDLHTLKYPLGSIVPDLRSIAHLCVPVHPGGGIHILRTTAMVNQLAMYHMKGMP